MPDTSPDSDHRVISFRRTPGSNPQAGSPPPPASPDKDFQEFERSREPDDYRERMITNVVGIAFVFLLICAGLWLADTMASMRKNQDCVLSGRRGCTPVDVPVQPRW